MKHDVGNYRGSLVVTENSTNFFLYRRIRARLLCPCWLFPHSVPIGHQNPPAFHSRAGSLCWEPPSSRGSINLSAPRRFARSLTALPSTVMAPFDCQAKKKKRCVRKWVAERTFVVFLGPRRNLRVPLFSEAAAAPAAGRGPGAGGPGPKAPGPSDPDP